jgi:hypothetical protein
MSGSFTSQTKSLLARRLREVREDRFGKHGVPELARHLGVPDRTWLNYESGVTIPGEVLLRFVEAAGVDAHWLSSGTGPKYVEQAVCR